MSVPVDIVLHQFYIKLSILVLEGTSLICNDVYFPATIKGYLNTGITDKEFKGAGLALWVHLYVLLAWRVSLLQSREFLLCSAECWLQGNSTDWFQHFLLCFTFTIFQENSLCRFLFILGIILVQIFIMQSYTVLCTARKWGLISQLKPKTDWFWQGFLQNPPPDASEEQRKNCWEICS